MTATKTVSTRLASGSGPLTVATLLDVISEAPMNAAVKVTSGSDQRDGASFWSVSVSWDGSSVRPSLLSYPPGVRDVDPYGFEAAAR